MSAEVAFEFVDTNVLVYAFDASAGARRSAAKRLLERLWESEAGCLSVQVLQEFFVTVTRKVPRPLAIDEAAERVSEFASWRVFAPTADDVSSAIKLHKSAKLSFWDAMIVHAAIECQSTVLWSEDMADGQLVRGVRVRNPFG